MKLLDLNSRFLISTIQTVIISDFWVLVKGRTSCFTNLQWYFYQRFTFVRLTTPNSVIYKVSEVQ
jgi:hypothetical protein